MRTEEGRDRDGPQGPCRHRIRRCGLVRGHRAEGSGRPLAFGPFVSWPALVRPFTIGSVGQGQAVVIGMQSAHDMAGSAPVTTRWTKGRLNRAALFVYGTLP